ncbi:DUF2306 domain-containing protein [Paenibacillus septentrionalis]|uniref:DUF2306 domain-containing protein n=1 Tax=Paenibacillus septentrionalis TaxID=429342 RepID=A0ABW1V6T8_9BACL
MKNRKFYFQLLACLSIVVIVYAIIKNYMIDPGATSFLSHKTATKRELNLPIWLNVMYIHVAFACVAMAAGLLNFSERMFEKSRKLHRFTGYVYIISVLIVVLSSGYMAPYATGGKISSMGFNALNIIWLIITATALIYMKKKQITKHRNWMIRSYAFCFTNMMIHLITTIFHKGLDFSYASSYTIGIYGSIASLLLIAELVIRTFTFNRPIQGR